MNKARQRERYQALRAMVDGATTEGERVAAQNALDRHVARWGEPPPPKANPFDFMDPFGRPREGREDVRERIKGRNGAWCRWSRIRPPLSPDLWRAVAPDGAVVFMNCITTRRKGGHRCSGCWTDFPKGSRMWRPIGYNGNHRMDRLCPSCFAPDPKGPPRLEGDGD